MITEDQQYVNYDKSDINYMEDKKKRHEIFENNFNRLLQVTKQDGFPKVSLKTYKQDSCKYEAVTMTIIHIAQSKPEVFFSKKIAHLFNQELRKGNIEKKLLQKSTVVMAKTMEICISQKKKMEYAINLWQIAQDTFQGEVVSDVVENATFINCKKN